MPSANDIISNTDAPGDLALKALRVSESRYRRLFETAQDGILLLNADTAQIEGVNPYLIEMLGYSHAEFLGKKLWEVGSFADIAQSKEMFEVLQIQGYVRYKDLPLKTKAGAKIAVEFVSNTYDCEGIKVIQCNIRNISESKTDRAKILRHTQLYAALSQCNKAIVHCASEEELFLQICRTAVQFGGMKMAWIGLIDAETRKVQAVASFGDVTGYLIDIDISVDAASPFGQGPTGIAGRKNQPYWCQDFMHDPVTISWRERAARAGWAASASLPLQREGIVVGVFTLYAGTVDSFDELARDLLVEMTADISFAQDNFARESQRKQAAEEITFKNTILKTQQETSLDAILVVDEQEQIISCNQQFIDLWRLSPQLVSARLDAPVLQAVAGQVENSAAFVARVQYLNEHRDAKSREEVLLKDGRVIDRYSAPVTGADRRYYGRVWYFRDITERKQSEEALRISEERFKTMFEQAPLGIALIDSLTGLIYESNPRFAEIAGRSMEEMANIYWIQITHPDDIQADLENMALLNAGKISGFQMEKRYRRPDGTSVWISMTVTPLKVENKAHPRHLAMIQDITERKMAEINIAFLNRVHALLSGINSLIVRVNDRNELFREACRIAVEAGGFRMSLLAILDKNTMKLVPVASAGKDDELMTAIKGLMSSSVDTAKTMVARAIREKKAIVSNDSKNDPRVLLGNKYAESGIRSMVILPLMVAGEAAGVIALYAGEIEFFHDEEMQLLTELAGDIAFAIDHIDKQERLNYLAYYDVLTGLANRSLFHERVAQYMRSALTGGYKLAIGLIDLERFKSINDSLGRTAGDALLRQVAEWLIHKTGDVNLLARIDADHFALVMPEVRQDGDLARLVEKTMEAFFQHPFYLNDAVFRIGVKVGIALFPDDGDDADTLFRNAEAALKKAKASGERYLFHTQKMTEAVSGKLTLENQLRQALDNEEFVLYYQPKVNIVSGKVTSAEALIRWNDPRTGLVPPDRFIPIMEETGLIYEVGRWALRKAIQDYLRWRDAGLAAVRIAVNVSPLQLRNRNFIAEIEQKISIDAHAAAGLELEITESLIMADIKHSISSLQAIRAMGITIAIDDFGTGFSSLSYLAKLPVDTLKIDRSFVIDMTAGPEGLALVSTIISLAHSLNLKVVAEGVETEEQSRLLRLLSCDEIQGFLFSKPVPRDIFEAKFLTQHPAGDA
jgi:diguanylate cyclase (GGDEF)-like protein/PAS domain S-box-containing protein